MGSKMGKIIEMFNEIRKKLTKKEKIVIIASMSALAVVLLAVVLLLVFCGRDNHKHDFEYQLIKQDDSFNLVVKCNNEGCDNPHYLVEGVEPTVESEIKPTCNKKGQTVYTYTQNGVTVKCTVESEAPTNKHILNGVFYKELCNEDGTINPDVEGVIVPNSSVDGINYECESSVKGHFVCEDCELPVQVDVYRDHDGVLMITEHADCVNPGQAQEICKYCLAELSDAEEIDPVGHNYTFEIVKNGEKSNLVGHCQREGCPDPEYIEEDVSDLKEISRSEATCSKPAEIVYSYKNKDGKTVQVKVYGETENHVLNGVDATTLANADGSYAHDLDGIKMFADKVAECGKLTNAYYVCEECEKLVYIQVIKPDHVMTLDYSTVVNPTLYTEGYIYYSCKNDGCTAPAIRLTLPKIVVGTNSEIIKEATADKDAVVKYTYEADFGQVVELELTLSTNHQHIYEYSIKQNGGKTNVVGKCTVEGCINPDFLAEDVKNLTVVEETNATCISPKKVKYSCTDADGSFTFEIYEGKKSSEHILNGVVAEGEHVVHVEGKTTHAYTYGTPGIIVFSSENIVPGKTVKGYFKCERCQELVSVWVFVPNDYEG